MNMKEAFPNLKFVGEGAKEFEQKEITPEQLERTKHVREKAAGFGKRIRAIFDEGCDAAK